MGFCVCSMYFCALLCVLSSFAIARELVGFILFAFLASCVFYCSVAFLRDAMGWSSMCDCGIS